MQLVYKLSPTSPSERQVLGSLGPKITSFTVGQTPDGKFVYTLKFKFPAVGEHGESGFCTLRLDEPLPGLLEWKVINRENDTFFRHHTGLETPALQVAAKKMVVTVGAKPDGKNYYLCEVVGFTSDAKIKAWGQYVNSEVKSIKSLTLPDEDEPSAAAAAEEVEI